MKGYRSIPAIEKENIKFLRFPNQEVLRNKKDKYCRSINVKRAMRLGNLEHEKVKIIFADDQGTKKVETTIWGVTEKAVILKQSTIIPLRRIISVN